MINFYRGLRSLYDATLHGEGIYFATDTFEIIHNGNSYSGVIKLDKSVKDVTITDGSLVITYTDNTSNSTPLQLEVVDNLESNAADKALSANQGRLLKEEIDNVKSQLVSVYTYKGSKATYEELPTDALPGDVWNVAAAYGNNPAGTNYAWVEDLLDEGHWDALGGAIDTSNFCDKAALTEVSDKVDEINLVLNGDEGLVSRLDSVEALIGEPTEEDTTTTMLVRLNALEAIVTGGGGSEEDQTLLQKVNANSLAIATLEATVNGENGLVKAVETLNGDASVEGSVDYKIDQAFAWIEIQ